MRILFENILENGTISGTNGSLNYPVSNLVHPFLRKRFQTLSVSSVVTILFTSDQIINSFFYGYHTLAGLTIVLKNSVDAVLDTIVVSDIKDIGVEYFTEQTTVRKIEVTATGPDPFYIGGLGAGVYYQMPDPLAAYPMTPLDNSVDVGSLSGQSLQNYVRPLRAYTFGFKDNERFIEKEVRALYFNVGVGRQMYYDFYEENRNKEEPMYGKFIAPIGSTYSPRRYDFSIQVQEAR